MALTGPLTRGLTSGLTAALTQGVGYYAPWEVALQQAPSVAVPTGGTVYVSGSDAANLPAGNDTTGDGSAAAPYATLDKVMSVLSTAGNRLVLCDGTFAENTAAGGRWVLNKLFTAPVVFDSYSGLASAFVITNASGSASVVNVRAARCGNIQVRRATIRSSTDSNALFRSNPASAGAFGSDISFFDCVWEARTLSVTNLAAIDLNSDFGIQGLHFVRCTFKQVNGGSLVNNPQLLDTTGMTQTIASQPHSDVGFWDCVTEGNWRSFTALMVAGINGFTFVRNAMTTLLNHAFVLGRDSSGDTTPKITNAYVQGNTLVASGSNAHGMVIGSNVQMSGEEPTDSDYVVIKGNTVTTVLQGIVAKATGKVLIDLNTVHDNAGANGGSALYAKASIGAKFRRNTVYLDGSAFTGYGFHEAEDGLNLPADTEFTGNTIVATGANAVALLWEDGTSSNGGAVANDNRITLASGADLGNVRGGSIDTQADLRAVWALNGLAGDDPTNDSRSTVAAA